MIKASHKILFVAVTAMFLATQAKAVLYWGRPYDPNLQRWIQRDPIAEQGGINLHQFVANNPINEIDPLGLLTAVIIGGPTSSNPFGHASIGFTGNGIYSFGTGTGLGSSFTEFLNNQATYRNSTVYILNTTPQQEQAMIDYLNKQKGKPLHDYPDNCAHRTSGALNAGGVAPPDLMFLDNGDWPGIIGNLLNDNSGNLQISILKGTMLPPKFLTSFNPK
jgi:RHS repeat-associated protein